MSNSVYFIPYLDGDWLGYGPLDSDIGYGLLPANEEEIQGNLASAVDFMRDHLDGRFVFGAHTGTYCREAFYSPRALDWYRRIAENGGEIAVHPHEERIKAGHFIDDTEHMRYVITWNRERLNEAGIRPTALRIPYSGYHPSLTRIAEDNELWVDISSAPGFVKEEWCADWAGEPYSAFFLDYEQPARSEAPPERRSKVLEVPLGGDGKGTSMMRNYLFVEMVPIDGLKAVWDAIVERAQHNGPQMIYMLSHLHSMADRELRGRLAEFLAYAQAQHGVPLVPSRAYQTFQELATTR